MAEAMAPHLGPTLRDVRGFVLHGGDSSIETSAGSEAERRRERLLQAIGKSYGTIDEDRASEVRAVGRQWEEVVRSGGSLLDIARFIWGYDAGAKVDFVVGEIFGLAIEIAGRRWKKPWERILLLPREDGNAPSIMILSPHLRSMSETRIVTDELGIDYQLFAAAMNMLRQDTNGSEYSVFINAMIASEVYKLTDILSVSMPDIILTRMPSMIPLCVPNPHICAQSHGQVSTAGIFCRDEDGTLGITACYHGTGPVGTNVLLDLRQSVVKAASPVQDIVFLPLADGYNLPSLAGCSGVLSSSEPARSSHAWFSGATNQNCRTRIAGADAGLLRSRPSIQLKIQTGPDTDRGDSGCALLDVDDHVVGFAFERTATDDFPQFTDWIWAANALRSLRLVAI